MIRSSYEYLQLPLLSLYTLEYRSSFLVRRTGTDNHSYLILYVTNLPCHRVQYSATHLPNPRDYLTEVIAIRFEVEIPIPLYLQLTHVLYIRLYNWFTSIFEYLPQRSHNFSRFINITVSSEERCGILVGGSPVWADDEAECCMAWSICRWSYFSGINSAAAVPSGVVGRPNFWLKKSSWSNGGVIGGGYDSTDVWVEVVWQNDDWASTTYSYRNCCWVSDWL